MELELQPLNLPSDNPRPFVINRRASYDNSTAAKETWLSYVSRRCVETTHKAGWL